MSFNYRTVVDGKGYRFTLPSLGIPDISGEWVVVECAIAKDPALLETAAASSSSPSSSSKPRMRFPFGDYATIKVDFDHAAWHLPILDFSKGQSEMEVFTVRVQRMPATQQQSGDDGNTTSTPVAPRSPSMMSLASSSDATFVDLDTASTLSDFSLSKSVSAVSLGGSSDTTSLTATASQASSSSDEEDDEYDNDSDACVDFGLDTGGAPPMSMMIAMARKKAQEVAAKLSGQAARDAIALADNVRGDFALQPNLYINPAFKYQVNWVRFVDELPQGDPVPAWAQSIDTRLKEDPTYWAVKVSERTCYHLAGVPRRFAQHYWRLLTGPGVPCEVEKDHQWIKFQINPAGHSWLKLCGELPSKARALLKVQPRPRDYACQPAGASAATSYMLNNYQVVIEQKGEEYIALEPLAELVDPVAELFLGQVAQYASVNGAPGKILYSASSVVDKEHWASNLYHVGVRLRDGGARFTIHRTSYPHRHVVSLPGTAKWLARWGTFERAPTGEKASERREMELVVKVPHGGHDLVLRVVDAPQGKFKKVEYVLRRQKDTEPIREDEWKPFRVGPKDGWVVSYFANLARLSFGRQKLIRPPRGTRIFGDG